MASEKQLYALRQQPPPSKFSRYRSVRRAKGIDAAAPPTPPLPVAPAAHDARVIKLPSRYHQKAKSADTTVETVADQGIGRVAPPYSHSASLAALTGESYPTPPVQHARSGRLRTVSDTGGLSSIPGPNKSIARPAHGCSHRPAVPSDQIPQVRQFRVDADSTLSPSATSHNGLKEETRETLRAEEERVRRIKAKQQGAREFERGERMASTEKRKPDGLLHAESDMAKADGSATRGTDMTLTTKRDDRGPSPPFEEADEPAQSNVRSARQNDTKVEDSGIGQRHAPVAVQTQPAAVQGLPLPGKLTRPNQIRFNPFKQQHATPSEDQPSISSASIWGKAEPGAIASDIPRSAVNAGERRVTVRYGESVISLPVTPTTTSQDVLLAASTQFSIQFDPQQSILSESFTQLGLERPLRRYEHVRDVMNSWDHDTQNQLLVVATSANILSASDVDPLALPKRPGGTSLYMYHSQRPGKWDKRWVSLREDGQISISKREDGSESANLCQLSDFDIYKPTHRQMKKLRPPKKACFAIKSQQKSVMFLNGANFVHFFASSEGPLTETWYSAVRAWRSWYLVTVLGEGKEQGSSRLSGTRSSAGTPRAAPVEVTKDQPAATQRLQQSPPGLLMNSSPTKSVPKAPSSMTMQSRDVREVSLRGRRAPPSSFLNHRIHRSDPIVPVSHPKRSPSFSRGSGKASSVRSAVEAPSSSNRSITRSRAGSIRQVHKPLVDLTPQFQEQPQHLRKGRGVTPVPGKPLVELATDVEAPPGAITVPPARAWRRPQNTKLGDMVSTVALAKSARSFVEPPSENMAFTGTGLLGRSTSRRTQGGIGHGYGVKTGDRNHVGEPLVDLRTESRFTDGSLLRQVEAWQGEDDYGLLVDRSKRTEKDVSIGEGV